MNPKLDEALSSKLQVRACRNKGNPIDRAFGHWRGSLGLLLLDLDLASDNGKMLQAGDHGDVAMGTFHARSLILESPGGGNP